jgi:hypothetical protein
MREQPHQPSQRSGCMTSIMVILGVYQILFAFRVLLNSGVKLDIAAYLPILQAIIALFWAGLFAHAVFRLRGNHAAAFRYSAWLIICFILSRLVQTILFVQADYDRNRVGFLLVVKLMILTVPVLLVWNQKQTDTHK